MNDDIIYYIHINGQQAGPFPKEKLIEVGMTPDSMVWRSDMPNWVEARTLPELMDLMNPPQPRPFSPQPPYVSNPQYNQGGYPPQAPYQPPYNGGYGPNNGYNGYNPGPRYPGAYPPGWKNWLAWAIIGTVITAIPSYGIGFITGIIAIIFSALANSEAKRGEWDSAQSKNTVAKVLTIITLILALLIVLGIILAFIFAFSFLSFLGAAF